MKYSFVALALVAAVSAQTREDIPSCALPCLDDAVSSVSTCKTTDIPCICKVFDKVQTAATSCILDKCGADTALNEVLPAAQKLCSGGSASSGAAESSAAAPTSTAAAESSAAQSSAAATSKAAESSAAASMSSAIASAASSAANTAKTGTAVVTSKPSSTPASQPSSPAVTTAGAATLGSIGAVAALFLGVLAL